MQGFTYLALRLSAYEAASRQEWVCSMSRTNPGLPLTVMTVKGALKPETVTEVSSLAGLRYVDDLRFQNFMGDGRYIASTA